MNSPARPQPHGRGPRPAAWPDDLPESLLSRSEGGVLHDAVSEVMDGTGMLANTRHVAKTARAAGATRALGGFLTNCCVESTMRSGYENGHQVITLNDCLAATSAEEHDNALKYDFPMFSRPMSSAVFITEPGG